MFNEHLTDFEDFQALIPLIQMLHIARDDHHAEDAMRQACIELGSLSGVTTNPIHGAEARTLPSNSFSYGT